MEQDFFRPCPQLTCEACKRRKVKCDKLYPCSNCRKAEIHCVAVERARLPRGRSAKKRKCLQREPSSRPELSDLFTRVSTLENLVQSLLDTRAEVPPLLGVLEDSTLPSVGSSCSELSTLASGDTLMNWTKEQAGRRLDDLINPLIAKDFCQTEVFGATASENSNPSNALSTRLLQIYMERVNPIFPILPCSLLWGLTTQTGGYLSYAKDHPAPTALACAISYMAISALGNGQCSQEFKASRDVLLDMHHSQTQLALERANYINTDDLTVLQAFVLYLVSIQAHDRSRRAWTLLSLALRIAQSLFLDTPNPPFVVSPLESEMRQRLWHLISLLDVQGSFDRGSTLMLHDADCLQSQDLLGTDVLDMSLPLTEQTSPDPGPISLADPTFMKIMAEAQYAFRSLNASDRRGSSPAGSDMCSRHNIAVNFQQKSQEILKGSELRTTPWHCFIEKIVSVTHAFLQLVVLQPVQGGSDSAPSRDVLSQSISLSLAVQFLQSLKELYQDPQIEPFRWFARLFVPWHAFSLAMDRVCACTDASLQVYYCPLIVGLHSSLGELMSDSHRSLLHRSLLNFSLLSETCTTQALATESLPGPSHLHRRGFPGFSTG